MGTSSKVTSTRQRLGGCSENEKQQGLVCLLLWLDVPIVQR